MDHQEWIQVRGARVHNLKAIDVNLPKNQLVVITGPSGSGKSSLAFDTIYAEGQRRYVESLSTKARQWIDQLEKPDVDSITGLTPSISLEQKTIHGQPRSTVGTMTEIYDFLRLLYARVAKPFCWQCQQRMAMQSVQDIVEQVLSFPQGTRIDLFAPLVREQKGEYRKECQRLQAQGFSRVRVDGEMFDLSQEICLDPHKNHTISVSIDRIVIKKGADVSSDLHSRIQEAVILGLKMGKGLLILEILEAQTHRPSERLFSEQLACIPCHLSYPFPEPRLFSFNHPLGACLGCHGMGELLEDGLLKPCPQCFGARLRKESLHFKLVGHSISELCQFSVVEMAEFFQNLSFSERESQIASRIVQDIQTRLYFLREVGVGYLQLNRSVQTLSGGEAQRMRFAAQMGSSLVGVTYVFDEPSIGLHAQDHDQLIQAFMRLRDLGNTVLVVEHDRETMERADWILDLGPGSGSRGGSLMASGPLSEILKSEKSLTGQYLRNDLKIDIPKQRRSWNARSPERCLVLEGASLNHLKNLTLKIPLGLLIGVTGVSGSGKSTLIMDTLCPGVQSALSSNSDHLDRQRLVFDSIRIKNLQGVQWIRQMISIHHGPIGQTPRSNPATYIGLFDLIRDLFAQLPESKMKGYRSGRYSFNVKGGRCEACQGGGLITVSMHFLPDAWVQCSVCHGKRYHSDTLSVKYKGKNIAELLEMTAAEAFVFFEAIPLIKNKIKILCEVGLGYLQLGQSSTTLSGGEAQRIKLAKELSKKNTGQTLYILDEPTFGLHWSDIQQLLLILHQLVDQGNTVIVIEHHLDVIKGVDYLIDLGPEGGALGGYLIATGTPEEVAQNSKSKTGKYLKKILFSSPRSHEINCDK